MYFAQYFKIKNFLVSVFISIILSSLTTFLYTKNTPGKTKITVLLKEDFNPDIYFIINNDKIGSIAELFESIRLEYFIKNFKESNNLKKLIFYKKINIKNLKQDCKKNMQIDYIEINKKTFAIEFYDKTENIEAINLCISSTLDLINNSINDQINSIIPELKFYYQKYFFVVIPPEIIANENLNLLYKNFLDLENQIKKTPIKIRMEARDETNISKFTNLKIYFATIFVCFFIITILILEKKHKHFSNKQ
jgi:hypothetical protein